MRRLLSSLTCRLPLLLCAAALCASSVPAQENSAAYPVRGTVVNTISGQPIARALVALGQDQATLTGSDGTFSFDRVPAGEYSISVRRPGYQGFGGTMPGMVMHVSLGAGRSENTPPRRIQVGPDMPALTFAITPLGMITGHVTLSTADPADGIQITIYRRQVQNGHAQWVSSGQAKTHSDGSFRIAGLMPGMYIVATQATLDSPGLSTGDRGPVWGFPAMYYPGVTDFSAAGKLVLAAGQQAEAELTLVRQRFFPVTALVQGVANAPASYEILDSGGRPTGQSASWDRREGVVRASVPNGTWTMEAHAYGRTMQWGSTTFQVNNAPVSFAIGIGPAPRIPVIVRRDFPPSTDGAQPETPGPGMNIFLQPADDISGSLSGGLNHDDATGEWYINVSQPGRYWVAAQAFPPAYIGSITSGGVDLGSNPLVVLPGSPPPPVEVTLRNDSGAITGQIAGQASDAGTSATNPGEHPQVWIYAIPLFSTPAQVPAASLQSNGEFRIPNVAPGSWRVVACDAPQEIDFHSPEGLAPWAGKGQTVTVDPSGTASVELDIIHTTAATP